MKSVLFKPVQNLWRRVAVIWAELDKNDGEIQNWRQPVSQQEKEKMLLLSLMYLSFVYLSAINPSQDWLSSSRGPEVNVQRLGLCSSHFDH